MRTEMNNFQLKIIWNRMFPSHNRSLFIFCPDFSLTCIKTFLLGEKNEKANSNWFKTTGRESYLSRAHTCTRAHFLSLSHTLPHTHTPTHTHIQVFLGNKTFLSERWKWPNMWCVLRFTRSHRQLASQQDDNKDAASKTQKVKTV